jgi:predicted nucleotidyltransferase
MTQQEINKIIIDYLMPYDPVKIGLFGSRLRGDHHEDSDLDILYNLKGNYTLFDLAGMYSDLEELLGIKVDLTNELRIKKEYRDYIMKDVQIIYEKR